MSEPEPVKRFPVVSALYSSFSSKKLYRDVAANWRAKAFLYLLLLLALTWLPGTLQTVIRMGALVSSGGREFFDQVPDITIEDGELSIDEPQPYVIRGGRDGSPLAIIDTTGMVTSLDDEEAGILVTATDVMFRTGPGQVREFGLSQIGDMTITAESLERQAQTVAPLIVIFAYPAVLVVSVIYRLIQALIYALFALLIARQQRLGLGFAALYSITLVAITPAVYMKTVIGLIGFETPFMFVPHIALALGYVYFGVSANQPRAVETNQEAQ